MLKTLITAVYPVQIVLSTSIKETLKYLDEVGMLTPDLEEELSFSDAFVQPLIGVQPDGSQSQFLLVAFNDLKTAKNVPILVHELTHVNSFISEFLGLRHDLDNDEWSAYFNQYLIQLFMDVIAKKDRVEVLSD